MAAREMQTSLEASSRGVLLDTAERLFSRAGFDGVSLRDLTREAGTNLAAVNYHFGSKEKLFEEVIVRRMRPINERRLAGLEAVLEQAADRQPALTAVLEVFARPFLVGGRRGQIEALRRIAVRLFMEADPLVRPIFEREIVPVARAFRAAIARACPQLSPRHVDMGLAFYAGAMVNLLATEKHKAMFRHAPGPAMSDEESLQALVRFGVAGFAGLGSASSGAAGTLALRNKN